jgi:hypothetical protein
VLLVECWNAIYDTMIAGLLYYRKFSESLAEQGYVANAYDPCVWNKVIRGKQSTICFHVDDCKISYVSEKMVAGLLYYRKFSESLAEQGYVVNAYDPCVWNKVIQGKQSTIRFHVDDCKISHVSEKVNKDTISWLRRDYESIFMDGSGEMKVARGKVHKYLGMKLDFNVGVVTVTMIDYVDDVIKVWDEAATKFMT